MKKQINPTIKAHLIRGAFYLLLLLAVCAIPFALAQRNAKQNAAAGKTSGVPSTGRLSPASAFRLPMPKLPNANGRDATVARVASLLGNDPLLTYVIDDGTAEDSIGLTAGGTFVSCNSFPVTGGNNVITSISIAWGTPLFPDPTLNGLSYTAVLWSDPNGDGSPTDAVVLAQAPAVISQEGTNTFITTAIPPTMVTTANFFVGFLITHTAGQFPAAFDEDAPTLPNRSFIALTSSINNLSGAAPIESFGLVGNWLIRADGNTGGPTPTGTPSPTPTATATPCTSQYTIAQIGGSIVPGTTDSGNHGDDQVTAIPLPFSYTLYDQTFNSINVSSNGNAQFTTVDTAFTNVCPLPWGAHNYTIFPYWDDQRTDAQSGCAAFPGGTCGVFTSVSGTAPNRIFNIEWRTVYFADVTMTANYELRLYEGITHFDMVWGATALGNSSATGGVQKDIAPNLTQYFCNGSGGAATGGQSYTLAPCASPTPTPSTTGTPTASPSCPPQQITTLFASNNGGNPGGAVYFDLTVASNPISVTAFDINTAQTLPFSNFRVYVLPGMTSVGNETNMALWTQVATGSGTGAGENLPTHVTLSNSIPLTAGTLYGIALVNDPAIEHDYTNGDGSNQNYSNADLALVLGSASNVPFTAPVFSPRVWNGTVYYASGSCGTPTATPTASPSVTATPTASASPTATVSGTPSPTPTCPPGGSPGPWTLAANYPLSLESAAVTSDGTFGYSAGGFAGSPTDAFYRYDPVANSWTPLANVTIGFYDAGIAYAANTNKIYVFGGFDPNFAVLTTTQIYDIATNTWTMGAPMPDANGRYFPAAVYYSGNGKIYVIGGFDGATFSEQSQTWEYDPVANTWNTSRAPIPIPMGGAGYSIVGGFVYLAGHWNNGLASTDHYQYDIVGNSWQAVAPVPVPIYRPAAAAVGTQTFLVGGGDPFVGAKGKTQRPRALPKTASMRAPATSYSSTYIYDTTSNSWSNGPNTNVPHSFTGGTAIGTLLMVVAGYDGNADTNTVETSPVGGPCGSPSPTPTCPPGGSPGPWTQAAPVGVDHYGGFIDSDGTFAYEGGGYSFSAGGTINQFGKFNPATNTWTPLAPVPDLTNAEASGVYAPNVNKLFVFGGDDPTSGIVVNTTRIYDIATNTWSTGMPMPDIRAFMASGYFNGKIYLVGGYSTGNVTPAFLQTWEYDTVANTFATKTSIPAAVGFGGAGSGVINGHLYVAGGRDANINVIATLWDYDIAADTWTPRANLPAPNNVPGSAVIAGKLWMFGGGNPFTGASTMPTSGNRGVRAWLKRLFTPDTTNALQVYDPAANSWTSGPNLNQQRSFPAGTDVGNTAVAVGGYDGSSSTTSVEINVAGGGCASPTPTVPPTATPTGSPSCTPGGTPGAWSTASPYPISIVRYGFAQTATHFYVFGGVSDGTRVPDVNRMDLATGTWESRAPMPFTSEAPTCALMASTGIVYCSEGDSGSGFASYNIATNTWTPLASDPFHTDHYGSASGAFNGKVFVAGGSTAFSSAVGVYDVATNTWSAGTAAPNDFLLAGYQQVGQYLYVVGGFEASGPVKPSAAQSSVLNRGQQSKQSKQPKVPMANNTTTWRLDMSSAPGVWTTGPAFTEGRADFGLAYDAGTNKLYALGGDLPGGGFFDSTNEVDELSVASWPAGSWTASPPDLLQPNRQANQAGFYGSGQIWSVGGLVGSTFQFLPEVQHRTNGGGPCGTPTATPTFTPTATATATFTPTATATATATFTPTATATATFTPTATATATTTATVPPRPTPTPRPRPTPRQHEGSNCFASSDCSGLPKTDTLTCVECLTQGGNSWLDGSGCHTTCP